MGYFKRDMYEGGKEDTKLVGAVIPTNIVQYLNLFCLVDNRSKSSIIRPMVEKWADKAKVKFPEDKLIALAAEKGFESWCNKSRKRTSFINALTYQKRELLSKGILETTVDLIIKRIVNLKMADDAKNEKD